MELTDVTHRSIPHATSPPVNHSLSVSPTNTATSPIKESPLAEPEGNNNDMQEAERVDQPGESPAAPEAVEAEQPTDAEVATESAE